MALKVHPATAFDGGGEPVRIVTAGYPTVLGHTILDKRCYWVAVVDLARLQEPDRINHHRRYRLRLRDSLPGRPVNRIEHVKIPRPFLGDIFEVGSLG